MTEGQKNIIPPPFGRAGVGFSIIPSERLRVGELRSGMGLGVVSPDCGYRAKKQQVSS